MKIEQLYPNKKLVIILDSVDQLDPFDYSLDWFIECFPSNVKMIFSTLSNHGHILQKIRLMEFMQQKSQNFLEIKSLDKELSMTIIKDWLKKENRSISEHQWDAIEGVFSKNANLYPLYVKLIFDIVAKWPSFYRPKIDDPNFMSCTSIDESIEFLFKKLELIHGRLLFSRSVIYLSSFKNGISESEIEDILSIGFEQIFIFN